MIKAHTLDAVICRPKGGAQCSSAWWLSAEEKVEVVDKQNMAFFPKIYESPCPKFEPWSSVLSSFQWCNNESQTKVKRAMLDAQNNSLLNWPQLFITLLQLLIAVLSSWGQYNEQNWVFRFTGCVIDEQQPHVVTVFIQSEGVGLTW